jgi:hypothetical protein
MQLYNRKKKQIKYMHLKRALEMKDLWNMCIIWILLTYQRIRILRVNLNTIIILSLFYII